MISALGGYTRTRLEVAGGCRKQPGSDPERSCSPGEEKGGAGLSSPGSSGPPDPEDGEDRKMVGESCGLTENPGLQNLEGRLHQNPIPGILRIRRGKGKLTRVR